MSYRKLSHPLILLATFLLSLPSLSPCAAGGPSTSAPHPSAWLSSKKEAIEKARKEKKLVIVDAFANWCGWCKRLDKDVLDTAPFIETTKKEYVLLRLNTEDGKEGSALAARFQVYNLPTTLILDENEALVGRIAGYVKMDEFLRHLANFRTGYLDLKNRETVLLNGGKKAGTGGAPRAEDAESLLALATEWQGRSDPKRAMDIGGKVGTIKGIPAEQRGRGLFIAASSALKAGRTEDAEKWTLQLERLQPFPALLDGLPELLRSDIAASRGDLDTAISILEELLQKGNQTADWRPGLPSRIAELKRTKLQLDLRRQKVSAQQHGGA